MDALLPSNLGFPSPQVIQEVYRQWVPDPQTFVGINQVFGGLKPWPNETPMWDVFKSVTGFMQPYSLDTKPPVIAFPKMDTVRQNALHFAESLPLQESDFLRLREAGTLDKLAGESLVMRLFQTLNIRMWTALEYYAWQAILGTITVNANGVKRTITYGIPNDHLVTAGTPWSTIASATIIENLQLWCELFLGKTDGQATLHLNFSDAKYLAQNAAVRDLLKQSVYVVQIGRDTIAEFLPKLVGCVEQINVYRGGYIDDAGAFQPFIPSGKAVLTTPPPNGQKVGYFYTTPSVHNGGATNPQPGPWTLVEDKSNELPAQYIGSAGINGVPAVQFPENIVVATIHS